MANCLVTGGAGGIGSHLIKRLRNDGHNVYSTDIRNDPYQDVRIPHGYIDLLTNYRIDWVFHLAALADIVPSIERPDDYHTTNVDGTFNLLEICRNVGVKRFIYAASSSCYGKNPPTPTCEHDHIEPAYPYALTKWIGEEYVLHYAKVYGLPAISLRLFNVYGSGFRTRGAYGSVFGVFLAQLANGLPLTIVGNGLQQRDFTFVSDVCDAFVKAAESDLTGEVFNVGSGKPQTINRLVELLGAHKTIHIPERPGEPFATHADISKIKEVLGWEPKVSFEEGVNEMRKHLSDYITAPQWTAEKIAKATKAWHECLGRFDA